MITLFSPEHPLPRGEELRGSVRKLRTEERRPDVLAMRREELHIFIFISFSTGRYLPLKTQLMQCIIFCCQEVFVFSQNLYLYAVILLVFVLVMRLQ